MGLMSLSLLIADSATKLRTGPMTLVAELEAH